MMINPISTFLRRRSDSSNGGSVSQLWSVVVPPNEIDLATEELLCVLLDTKWTVGSDLVIDLSSVTFMDSTAIHWLFSARERAHQAGRQLRLIGPEQGHVERLLAIVGVAELFPIYPSLEKALES
jgi:anti-sigma B factor antagonist